MIINIQATLTDEQALILATEKGYNPTVTVLEGNDVVGTAPNPETSFEFLKKVYESMIVTDATKHYVEFDERKTKAEREANANLIRQSVIDSVTSSAV